MIDSVDKTPEAPKEVLGTDESRLKIHRVR